MNYPIIRIPGFPVGMRNKNIPNCRHMSAAQQIAHVKKHGDKARRCKKYPAIASGVTEKERINICTIIRRQWGRTMIATPVRVAFLFKIPAFPYHNRHDLSNAEQLYEDLLQEQLEEFVKYEQVIKRVGSNVIKNDKLIQSHDGSRFFWLCECCAAGNAEKETRSKRKGLAVPCPGSTKCPYVGIEIFITDYTRPHPSAEEIEEVFGL